MVVVVVLVVVVVVDVVDAVETAPPIPGNFNPNPEAVPPNTPAKVDGAPNENPVAAVEVEAFENEVNSMAPELAVAAKVDAEAKPWWQRRRSLSDLEINRPVAETAEQPERLAGANLAWKEIGLHSGRVRDGESLTETEA